MAVTGVGLITPMGRDFDTVFSATMAGRSAVAPVTLTNSASGETLVIPAARVPDEVCATLPKSLMLMTDRFAQLALQAAGDAVANAGIDWNREDRTRCGVASGSCMNGITETEVGFETIFVRKRPKVHPFTLIRTMPNAPAAYIAMAHGLAGPALHHSTTCSSSSVAIGEAARQIRHGYADVMVAGGTESLITYSAVNCWYASALLAPLAEEPSQSCRPFDATRAGTVLGEGAVFVVLEDMNRARRRGASILAELVGYACFADSAHVTQPSADAQALPMRGALADARLAPEAVGYISAHGTGTKVNDVAETRAIRSVFGAHADRLAVSSPKGAFGHLVGAAGALGLALCIGALATGKVPPTANLTTPDMDCDLDYVPIQGRATPDLGAAMCNAFGFGGTAASLVVALAQ